MRFVGSYRNIEKLKVPVILVGFAKLTGFS